MNSTFKVVWSKARGALMVVNEATSSVQAKGTKTVIAAAVAALVAGGAMAADENVFENKTEFNSNTLLQAWSQAQNSPDALEVSGKTYQNNKVTFPNTSGSTTALGVAAISSDVIIADSNFKANAVSDTKDSANGAYGSAVGVQTGKLTITGSIFDSNEATSHRQVQGSALYQSVGSIDLQNSTFTNNKGTAAEGSDANVTGGAVSLWGVSGSIKNSEFTGNVATAGNIVYGGALYLRSGIWGGDKALQFSIEDSTFTGNKTLATSSKSGSLGGAVYAKSDFSYDKSEVSRYVIDLDIKNVSFKNNESDWMGGALFVTGEGAVTMTDVTFEGNTSSAGGAAMFYGNKPNESALDKTNTAQITAQNVNYINNAGINEGQGGAVFLYTKTKYEQTGGSFVGNKADGFGGAIFVKGAEAVFTDVLFENNVVENEKAVVAGGAVYVDPVINGNVVGGKVPASAKFVITKDMTYSGNNAIGLEENHNENTYGYLIGTSGGFLLLDRGSSATFDIAENATLTLGKEDAAGNMDSIASAYPDKNDPNMVSASITKTGQGTLLINSDLNKYYGTFDIQDGRMDVRKSWTIKDYVDVNGGTLALADFDFGNQPDPVTNRVGSITVKSGGTLETSSGQVFSTALAADGTTKAAGELLYSADKLSFEEGSALALTDALYNLDYAQSAGALLKTGKVTMLGDLINKDSVNEATLGELEQVGENTELSNVTVKAEDKNIQIGGTLASGEEANTNLREESLSVGAIDLGDATGVTIAGGKTLTLAGNGEQIVKSNDETGAKIVVEDGTLALGGTVSKGGTVEAVEVQANGNVTVVGDAAYTIETLTGAGNVYVGTDEKAGNVVINDISGMSGMIVADPETAASAPETSGGRVNGFSDADNPVSVYLVAARNGFWATDADKAEGVAAFEKIAAAQGLAWGEDVTAALYVGKTLQLGTNGSVLVDGSVTSGNEPARTNGTATVNAKGMMIVNQNVGEPVVGGNVVLANGSYIGVMNSAVGELKLATGTVTDNGTAIMTDNPFIEGSLNAAEGTIVNELDADSGLGALASTGIQAMARRADFVMTETVANRTSLDQPRHAGVNLWADVTGERYEADKLDNGGSFRADAGYGTFGADLEVLDGMTAGLALQYGDASLRSSVSGIKNDITSYGLTAYVGQSFGAAKVVGELAWLKSENDITAAQSALSQKLDANIYSAGVRAQYELGAGSFKFVPSIGLRVSRLETDDMNVGTIKVDDADLTYVQMPISLRITGFEADAAGWSFAPSFKVAYVPTFGDKEVKVLGYGQDVLDMSPVQADFGLRAVNGNLMFNLDMMVGGGEAGTSSIGGKMGVKYAF